MLGAALLAPTGVMAAEDGKFSDINGHYAQKQIELMAQKGIVSGMRMGRFEPDRKIDKGHLEMLLEKTSGKEVKLEVDHRAAVVTAVVYNFDLTAEADKLTDEDVQAALEKFSDKDMIPAQDLKAAAYLVKEGVISGVTPNEFKPHESITRGEVVATLGRLAEKGKIILQNHKDKAKETMMKDKQGMMAGDMMAKMDMKMTDMKAMMEKHQAMISDMMAMMEQLQKDGKLSSDQLMKLEEMKKMMAEHRTMMDNMMKGMMKDAMVKEMTGMTGDNMAGTDQGNMVAEQPVQNDQTAGHNHQG
jgi:uncharacterized coiled-coil protein SlyX